MGRVELPAYGLADAEHQVEKEILALVPDAQVDVTDVGRVDERSRIVEEFRVSYRIRAVVEVQAASPAEAGRTALRQLRERFAGSRYERVAWTVLGAAGGSISPS